MTRLFTSVLSSKAQITLPQKVRAFLGVKAKGDLVGFLVDDETRSVRMAKVETVLSDADFEAEEYRKLLGLRRGKPTKTFRSMASLIRDLKA